MKINVSAFRGVATVSEKSCPELFATGHVLRCSFSRSGLNHSFFSCCVVTYTASPCCCSVKLLVREGFPNHYYFSILELQVCYLHLTG